MSITQTVLTFVGAPAAVVALVYIGVYSFSARQGSKRYRPGRPFTFAPVWFLASAGPGGGSGKAGDALPAASPSAGALPAGTPTGAAHGETGGASDSW